MICLTHCAAQEINNVKHIKGCCFEGYIFPTTYIGSIPIDNGHERFTPEAKDIAKAEAILNKQISKLNSDLLNQTEGCPIIHKKLKKYKRQYFGVITENGEKVIWINFIWSKDEIALRQWKKDVIIILDGCSFYWNIKVNLTKEKLFDLNVNGSA